MVQMAAEVNGRSQPNTLERDFSKVILTLDNVIVPDEKLHPTPSSLDGLDSEVETDLRILGCELIQTSGCLLKLPQVAMACGQVLFQRFYYSKSFVKHDCETVAMACINLAAKIEESPRRMRDVINVFHHVRQVRTGKNISPLILDQNYIALKNKVIKAERRILKELGFCVHVKHPHKIIVTYLQVLESETNSKLVQQAWNYMNDSFRTDVFLRYTPETIACACIHLAGRQLQIPMPSQPSWYNIFMVDGDEVNAICISILRLYSRPKVDSEALEKRVNEVKRKQQESKRGKGISSDVGTPNSNSRNVSPKPSSPAVKKVKSEEDRSDHSAGHERRRRSRSRSRSPLPRRYKERSRSRSSVSRSRSRSPTPPPKRSRHSSPPPGRKRKDRPSRERGRHKRRRSFSRSYSRSISHSPKRKSKKAKARYRSRSRSFTPEKKSRVSDKYRR